VHRLSFGAASGGFETLTAIPKLTSGSPSGSWSPAAPGGGTNQETQINPTEQATPLRQRRCSPADQLEEIIGSESPQAS
jgi:hypothetical protein